MLDVLELQRLGVAVGLGFLVGLQRQRAESEVGGIRTFPLIAVSGSLCALLAAKFGGWIVGAGLLCICVLMVISNHQRAVKNEDPSPGITTEVSALLMYAIGAFAMFGALPIVLSIGAGMAVLLHFKRPLHVFLDRIGEQDMLAIMQFVLIALVILPILPNKSFGPYDLLNPFETWFVVVLIVGISLGGYLTYKVLDSKLGLLIGAILGGLISSTATTIEYARKTAKKADSAIIAATVISIASTVSVIRVIVEIAVIAPSLFAALTVPCAVFLMGMIVASAIFFFNTKQSPASLGTQGNPAHLKGAIVFALLYTLIGFAVAITKDMIGSQGLYVVGAVSGLTDVDALTLSTAKMAQKGGLEPHVAWQVILIGILSNTTFKGIAAIAISRGLLTKYLAPAFAGAVAVGVAVLLLWPPSLTKTIAENTSTKRAFASKPKEETGKDGESRSSADEKPATSSADEPH